jgi:iron complex outermembrane receptor protein
MSLSSAASRPSTTHRRAALLLVASASSALHAAAAQPTAESQREIVVTARPLFSDVHAERELDQQDVASYGVSTVDELLAEIEGDLGDDEQPMIFVNGERISDPSEIAGLPVETLRNVRILPRGSAVRAGGRTSQRVVSITLAPRTRSATLTGATKIATGGHWDAERGEAILTNVVRSTRANLALRVGRESALLESDRGIVQPMLAESYATAGNIVGYPNPGGEVDPLLSAAAGQIVTVVPLLTGAPTLADFAGRANDSNVTDAGRFRTLRPQNRNYDLNGTYSTRLAPWLTSTATVHVTRNLSDSRHGLPAALLILPADNAYSPFSQDVGLAFYGLRPLRSHSRRDNADGLLTLNGNFGAWSSTLTARHSETRNDSEYERQGSSSILLDDTVNPFTTSFTAPIQIRRDRATSRSLTDLVQLLINGPAAKLPAGDAELTIEGRLAWNRLRSTSSVLATPNRSFRRSEQAVRAAIDVPLTGGDNNFLAAVGVLSANAEFGQTHISDAGSLTRRAFGLDWAPRPNVQFHASTELAEAASSIESLGDPVIITPDVRMFDPLTGQTVDVTQISGGNPDLLPQSVRTQRLSGEWGVLPRLNLKLNAEYTDVDARNFVSSLPQASAAVMLAFPDRFVRDVNNVLTQVDLRPVNFDFHREKRLRYGFSLSEPLHRPRPRAPLDRARPTTRVQLSLNDTLVLSDEIRIRPELPNVNLLDGGAIGIASGRVRHQIDGTAALSSGPMGVRLGLTWRGKSSLQTRVAQNVEFLRFSPLLLVNVRAFADLAGLFGSAPLTRSTRLSLNVTNLFNNRQLVRDSLGATPLQYQPAYRDPLGRTVELELRKVF